MLFFINATIRIALPTENMNGVDEIYVDTDVRHWKSLKTTSKVTANKNEVNAFNVEKKQRRFHSFINLHG